MSEQKLNIGETAVDLSKAVDYLGPGVTIATALVYLKETLNIPGANDNDAGILFRLVSAETWGEAGKNTNKDGPRAQRHGA